MNLRLKQLNSVDEISAQDWNRLNLSQNPFLDHRFFSALEKSGSVAISGGWKPSHLSWYDENDVLQALMPLYFKNHSYGEYMFDWNWANGIQRAGINYYPKAVAAIPFTPVSGNRLMLSEPLTTSEIIRSELLQSLFQTLSYEQLSNLQALYLTKQESSDWQKAGAIIRQGYQFSWYNGHANNKGETQTSYSDFDDFLSRLNSKARKQIKRERRSVSAAEVTFEQLEGENIDDDSWNFFIECYQLTYLKRSGHEGYLNLEFFRQFRDSMPENLLLIMASRGGKRLASSLFIKGNNILYGRYWGAMEKVDGLHFECCYYQAIEYCIKHKILCLQPGTQGDYKRRRGFIAEAVFGAYYFTLDELKKPIAHYLNDEIEGLEEQFKEWDNSTPYRKQ